MAGLSGVVVVDSLRETRAGNERETRLYLTRPTSAQNNSDPLSSSTGASKTASTG